MNQTLINTISVYNKEKVLSTEQLTSLYQVSFQKELINYLQQNPNRNFALYFMNDVIKRRMRNDEFSDGEYIAYAAYMLAIHKDPEDSLLIWEAKEIDFDIYCFLDIQLCLGAGLDETLNYLQDSKHINSKSLSNYILECVNANPVHFKKYLIKYYEEFDQYYL